MKSLVVWCNRSANLYRLRSQSLDCKNEFKKRNLQKRLPHTLAIGKKMVLNVVTTVIFHIPVQSSMYFQYRTFKTRLCFPEWIALQGLPSSGEPKPDQVIELQIRKRCQDWKSLRVVVNKDAGATNSRKNFVVSFRNYLQCLSKRHLFFKDSCTKEIICIDHPN